MDFVCEYNPQNFLVVDDLIELLMKKKLENLSLYFIESYDSDKLYSEFYNLKKKLQLYFNHYNNNELYKSCLLKDDEKFTSVHPDGEIQICHIIDDFVKHFCTIWKMETRNEKQEMIIPENCFYCENPIESDDETCSVCLALVSEMATKSRNNNDHNIDRSGESSFSGNEKTIMKNNENRNEEGKEMPLTTENEDYSTNNNTSKKILEHDVGKENPIRNDKNEENVTNLKSFHKLLIDNRDKWLCEMCQCLNPFQSADCQGCLNSCRDKCIWMCSWCDLINHINTSICSACEKRDKSVERFLMWKCWKPHCEHLNNPDCKFCKKCFLQRDAPKSLSDIIERQMGNGRILKFWICEKCWKYNNENFRKCEGKNCGHLRYENAVKWNATNSQINTGQIESQHSDNKITLNPNQWQCEKCTLVNENRDYKCVVCNFPSQSHRSPWQCWKVNCGKKNKGEDVFCLQCKLDRNPPDPITKLVKSYAGKEIKEIWICEKCGNENRKENDKCDKKNCYQSKLNARSKEITNHKEIITNQKEELQQNGNEIILNLNQWRCEKCTLINKNNIFQCSACNWERKLDCWQCWNGDCNAVNKGVNMFCQKCKLDRNPPDPKTKLVKSYAGGEEKEIWICSKCKKKNKKEDAKCAGNNCHTFKFYDGTNSTNKDNDRVTVTLHNPNYGKGQKANNINNENLSNGNSWKCWFGNCKQLNVAGEEFCKNCRLHRYGTPDPGALVKVRNKNGDVDDMWICHKCFKYNELTDAQCRGKSCKLGRFDYV